MIPEILQIVLSRAPRASISRRHWSASCGMSPGPSVPADGDPFTMARSVILQHFFNHQTHHRGQAHDLLSQTGVAPPVLDLLYFVRE